MHFRHHEVVHERIEAYFWVSFSVAFTETFSKNDIEVSYADNQLTIKSTFEKDGKDEGKESVHRGISKRQFTKRFTLADEVVVNAAELKDGMLRVELEKIVPEEKKPRTIKIK